MSSVSVISALVAISFALTHALCLDEFQSRVVAEWSSSVFTGGLDQYDRCIVRSLEDDVKLELLRYASRRRSVRARASEFTATIRGRGFDSDLVEVQRRDDALFKRTFNLEDKLYDTAMDAFATALSKLDNADAHRLNKWYHFCDRKGNELSAKARGSRTEEAYVKSRQAAFWYYQAIQGRLVAQKLYKGRSDPGDHKTAIKVARSKLQAAIGTMNALWTAMGEMAADQKPLLPPPAPKGPKGPDSNPNPNPNIHPKPNPNFNPNTHPGGNSNPNTHPGPNPNPKQSDRPGPSTDINTHTEPSTNPPSEHGSVPPN